MRVLPLSRVKAGVGGFVASWLAFIRLLRVLTNAQSLVREGKAAEN